MNPKAIVKTSQKDSKLAETIFHIIFIAFSLACIMPIVLIVAISFSDEKLLTLQGYKFWPDKLDVSAYQYLFTNSTTLVKAYGVSLSVTIIGTILAVLLIALYAYPIFRKDFPFKKAFNFYLLITMFFSGGAGPVLFAIRQLFGAEGLVRRAHSSWPFERVLYLHYSYLLSADSGRDD